MGEILALEQQWFAADPRQRISEAIPEIETSRMAAASTEIPVGLPRDPSLPLGNWLDFEAGFADQIIEAPAGDRVAATVHDNRSLDEIDRRNATA
jgi:hypothetical protein